MPSGAWKKRTQTVRRVRLVAPIDPRHSTPEETQDPNYVDTTGAPALPEDVEGGQFTQQDVKSRYVDLTPPGEGVGDLPGYDQASAREVSRIAHSRDYGAVSARLYAPAVDRDGTYNVSIVTNHDNAGDSPETLQFERTGVGSPNDPYARSNKRIVRWRDRTIDMHWWGVEQRPKPIRTAQGSRELPPVPNRTQWVSPFAAGRIEHPDNWQPAQERRAPREWGERTTTDGGEADAMSAASAYGLTMWGL
jgi:hypothetical protein